MSRDRELTDKCGEKPTFGSPYRHTSIHLNLSEQSARHSNQNVITNLSLKCLMVRYAFYKISKRRVITCYQFSVSWVTRIDEIVSSVELSFKLKWICLQSATHINSMMMISHVDTLSLGHYEITTRCEGLYRRRRNSIHSLSLVLISDKLHLRSSELWSLNGVKWWRQRNISIPRQCSTQICLISSLHLVFASLNI